MKILFLDIDGVLNSQTFNNSHVRRSLIADETSIDPINVGVLQNLLNEIPDIRIVISSSWRKFHSLDDLKSILQSYGLDSSKIIDCTPNLDTIRGIEVQTWLNKNNNPPFLILDDDTDMGELLPFLIKTNVMTGLTKEDVNKIKVFFGRIKE